MCQQQNILQTYQLVYAIKYSRQDIQRKPICTSDADHHYILYQIMRRDQNKYERHIHNDDNSKYFPNENINIITFHM